MSFLPFSARWNLFNEYPQVAFGIVLFCLSLVVFVGIRGLSYLSLAMAVGLVCSVFASYQATVIAGSLLKMDQHITLSFVRRISESGSLPEPRVRLRGAVKIDHYPPLYTFISSVKTIFGITPWMSVRMFPIQILTPLPIIAFAMTKRNRIWTALPWISPVFFISFGALAVQQLFVLPLLAVLFFTLHRARGDDRRIVFLFVLVSLLLPLFHSYTSVIAAFVVVSYAIGTFMRSLDVTTRPLLYVMSIVSIWLIVGNETLLAPLGYFLFTFGLGSLTGLVSTAAFPYPLIWWIGQFLRLAFFIFLGLAFLQTLSINRKSIQRLLAPEILTLGVAGLASFLFPVIFGISNLDRGWLMVTLFAGPAVATVLQMQDDRTASILSLRVGGSILLSVATALFMIYVWLYMRGDIAFNTEHVLAIAVFGAVTGVLIVAGSFREQTGSSRLVLMTAVVFLLAGGAFAGMPADTFSSDARTDSLTSVGIPAYHQKSTYEMGSFIEQYTSGPVVGDRRSFFVVEELHRRPNSEHPACYTGSCEYDTVVWFDTYTEMWIGAEKIIQPYAFERGKKYLSTDRQLIYTTGSTTVFVGDSRKN